MSASARTLSLAISVAATGCHAAAGPPLASPSPAAVTRSEPAPDPRCEDEPLGVLHMTDPSYAVSAEEVVARVLRAHQPAMMRCVFHRRHELPDIGGKLVLTLRIDASGTAAHVLTRGPDPELDQCVCAAVLALKFDPIESATVSYPLYFGP